MRVVFSVKKLLQPRGFNVRTLSWVKKHRTLKLEFMPAEEVFWAAGNHVIFCFTGSFYFVWFLSGSSLCGCES
jgi:hypothetical protein